MNNYNKILLLLVVLVTSVVMPASNVYAETFFPVEYRVSESIGKTDDVNQYAIVLPVPAPRRLRANRLELGIGTFSSPLEDRPFVSLGAVWRVQPRWLPLIRDRLHVDVGFSPTWIAGSRLNGIDLGGNLHFTSSISVGRFIDRKETVALSLRIQHTSNGGLHGTNPGLDMLGLNLTFQPGGR